MSRKKPKPFWERAYKGHAFWLGKQKLGKVSLLGKDEYAWQAAGRAGTAEALEQAKRAVELAVLMADRQPDLFSTPNSGTGHDISQSEKSWSVPD